MGQAAEGRKKETWGQYLRESYMVFDRRSLGLTRILLGFYLIMDLFRRTADWEHMFGDKGVLPSWVILNRPQSGNFSLLHGFTSGPELWVLWGVILATYVLFLVGWKTKVWQITSLLFVTSMNGRVLLIENGGYVIQNLVLLWTAFLPLGDRFSLDSMLASLRRKREGKVDDLNDRNGMDDTLKLGKFYSFVGVAIAFQFAAIYYFNVVHKTGPNWHNGQAVHYVLYNDRMATPLVAAVREYVPFWLVKFVTPAVLVAEGILPFCTLLPRLELWDLQVKVWLKRIAVTLICMLHIGFGSSFVLGPFAWALCIFSTVMFQTEDWETTIAAMRKTSRERTVILDPSSGALLFFGRILARMDRFRLLGFTEAETAAERSAGISVLMPTGEVLSGHRAVAEIVRALPIGPAFAWMPNAPVLSSIVDGLLSFLRGRTSRFFGLTPESAAVGPRRTGPAFEVAGRFLRARLFARAGLREVICVVMFVSAFNQALTELWSTKKPWNKLITSLNQTGPIQNLGVTLSPQPESMRLLSHKLRFLQGWFMFSPNPVMDDGTIIVDAVTVDGRHIDPFWDTPPDFDIVHVQSYKYNQIWSDYFNRMHFAGNNGYRDAMVDYLRRFPERTGDPNDTLVSGEVYWVSDMNPKWGTRNSWGDKRELLFSFGEKGGAIKPAVEVASNQ